MDNPGISNFKCTTYMLLSQREKSLALPQAGHMLVYCIVRENERDLFT